MCFRLNRFELGFYLYAPKDDIKHRALWREMYNEKEIGDRFNNYQLNNLNNNVQYPLRHSCHECSRFDIHDNHNNVCFNRLYSLTIAIFKALSSLHVLTTHSHKSQCFCPPPLHKQFFSCQFSIVILITFLAVCLFFLYFLQTT